MIDLRGQRRKLVIAKMDRLARNIAFMSSLIEDGVEFIAVDIRKVNKLKVQILAAQVEHAREMISELIRAALVAAKARGGSWVNWAKKTSEHGQISKIRLSDVSSENTIPTEVTFGYLRYGFESYMGNIR